MKVPVNFTLLEALFTVNSHQLLFRMHFLFHNFDFFIFSFAHYVHHPSKNAPYRHPHPSQLPKGFFEGRWHRGYFHQFCASIWVPMIAWIAVLWVKQNNILKTCWLFNLSNQINKRKDFTLLAKISSFCLFPKNWNIK